MTHERDKSFKYEFLKFVKFKMDAKGSKPTTFLYSKYDIYHL